MSRAYVIEPIGRETIARAYPLIRAVVPEVTEHEWSQINDQQRAGGTLRATSGQREDVVIARDAKGYVKALCIYAVRDHATYGRIIDVPILIIASAADAEGVAAALIHFLRDTCNRAICSGVRFWAFDREAWAHRLCPNHIARSDHGLFLPALTSDAGMTRAQRAPTINVGEAIDRFSR